MQWAQRQGSGESCACSLVFNPRGESRWFCGQHRSGLLVKTGGDADAAHGSLLGEGGITARAMVLAGTVHGGEASCLLKALGGTAGGGGPCLCSIHGGEASPSAGSFLNLPLL